MLIPIKPVKELKKKNGINLNKNHVFVNFSFVQINIKKFPLNYFSNKARCKIAFSNTFSR